MGAVDGLKRRAWSRGDVRTASEREWLQRARGRRWGGRRSEKAGALPSGRPGYWGRRDTHESRTERVIACSSDEEKRALER